MKFNLFCLLLPLATLAGCLQQHAPATPVPSVDVTQNVQPVFPD